MKTFQKSLHTTPAGFLELHFGDMIFLSQKIPGKDAYLTILGDPAINVGYLRLEMRKVIRGIAKLI